MAFHPSGLVNEYQLRLGKQGQVWLIPIADKRVGVQVKLWNPLRTRAIPEHFWGDESLRRGTISYVLPLQKSFTIKLLIQAPGFYWNKWPGPRLVLETWLVLKHFQLAILNFLCVYGILDFKYETQQTNTFSFHFVYWAYFCHNWHQVDNRLVIQTSIGKSDLDSPACIRDPASIWDPACITSSMYDNQFSQNSVERCHLSMGHRRNDKILLTNRITLCYGQGWVTAGWRGKSHMFYQHLFHRDLQFCGTMVTQLRVWCWIQDLDLD